MSGVGRIRWVGSQVERFFKAGRAYNRRLRAAWKREGYSGEPPTVDLNAIYEASRRGEESPINTRNDLNRLINTWNRFNEVKRPGSTRPVTTESGEVVPRYFVTERRNQIAQENRKRNKVRRNLYPEWDDLDNVDKAIALSNKNLHPLDYPDGENPLDKIGKFGVYSSSDQEYAVRYADTLESLYSKDKDLMEVVEIINRLSIENPLGLREVFENPMNDDVTSINFIYEESSNMTSWVDYERAGRQRKGRRRQIIEFWKEVEREYLR